MKGSDGKQVLLLSYGSFGPEKKRKGAYVDFGKQRRLTIFQCDLRYKEHQCGFLSPPDGAFASPEELSALYDPHNIVYINRVDNQKRFPFETGQFYRIIMRKGLCQCHNRQIGCGGVSGDPDTAFRFVCEVARVLSRTKGAAAYLHGASKNVDFAMWQHVAQQVHDHFGGRLVVGVAVNDSERCNGIKLVWKRGRGDGDEMEERGGLGLARPASVQPDHLAGGLCQPMDKDDDDYYYTYEYEDVEDKGGDPFAQVVQCDVPGRVVRSLREERASGGGRRGNSHQSLVPNEVGGKGSKGKDKAKAKAKGKDKKDKGKDKKDRGKDKKNKGKDKNDRGKDKKDRGNKTGCE